MENIMIKYFSLLVFVLYVSCGTMSWGDHQPLLESRHKTFQKGETYNSQKPVVCQHPDLILHTLTKDWQEAPIMRWDNVSVRENGELMNTTIGFGLNKQTGTWSLVEFIDEDWACIIANGWGFTIFTPE